MIRKDGVVVILFLVVVGIVCKKRFKNLVNWYSKF